MHRPAKTLRHALPCVLAGALGGLLAGACGDDDAFDLGGGDRGDAGATAGDAASGDGGGDAIDARIDALFPGEPPFGALDRGLVRRMMEREAGDDDGPFFMVNLIQYRQRAAYPDGRDAELSGAEADARYGELILPILSDIGARPIFVAEVETTLMADDDARFDQVGVVRYPSRAAFFEMLARDDFRAASEHKAAGVERTLVMPSEPIEMAAPEGFLELDLQSVPFPPTDEDPPVAIVHLYDYREQALYEDGRETDLSGEEAVALYTSNRGAQGVLELGVRPALWLDVEGVLIGDARQFEELRINLFPSHATFFEVAAASEEAGIEHRAAGLEHHYSLITLPLINEYGYREPE